MTTFLTLSRFFLYASLLCILVVLPNTFFPFIGGKYYFFRAAIGFSLIFALFHWAFEARKGEVEQYVKKMVRQPLFIAVSAFSGVFLLAAIFAHDPSAAFWSNFERGEGAFQMLHYYALFVLSVFLFREWKDWRRAFVISIIAASLMILYGFLGYVSLFNQSLFCSGDTPSRATCINFITPLQGNVPEGLTFWRVLTEQRFQGTLGNPAYVAPYLIFAIFYALYVWYTHKSHDKRIEWVRRIWYGFLIFTFLFFFAVSQTRGAFIGLGGAVIAFFVFQIFTQRKYWKASAITLGLLLLIGGFAIANREHPFIKKLPGSRLLALDFSEQTLQTRLWTWGSAYRGWQERPLLGWGPENFSSVFDKHFDPRHFNPNQNSETWFDRAHSVFFDYLAETGILGLLSYFSIFVVFYYQFFRFRGRLEKNQEHKKHFAFPASPILFGLLFVIPIAYLLQGFFLFDVLPIYMNLFLFLAFATSQFYLASIHERNA